MIILINNYAFDESEIYCLNKYSINLNATSAKMIVAEFSLIRIYQNSKREKAEQEKETNHHHQSHELVRDPSLYLSHHNLLLFKM